MVELNLSDIFRLKLYQSSDQFWLYKKLWGLTYRLSASLIDQNEDGHAGLILCGN